MIDVDQFYDEHVQLLSDTEQLRLVGRLVDRIAQQRGGLPCRSTTELHGKGADVWRDVDAAAYVDKLRLEWDQRL